MFKRILAFILSITLLIGTLPISFSVSAATYSGKCGNDVYWEIENGVLTISGTGNMFNYMYYFNSGPDWNPDMLSSSGQIPFDEVIIESGVTSIGENAFRGCKFSRISIPNTVTRIEEGAFCGVSGLTDIRIPEGVTHVMREGLALNGGNIYLPRSLEFVGNHAFSGQINNQVNYVFIPMSKSESLQNIKFMDKDYYSDYINMPNVTFIYDCSIVSIDGFFMSRRYNNFYNFVGDTRVFNSNSPKDKRAYDLLDNRCGYEGGYTFSDITWSSSDDSILRIEPVDAKVPLFHGQSSGVVTVTATNKNGKSLDFEVTVIDPLELSITSLYDTKQYYYDGGFYSAVSSLSNSAEVYLEYSNKINTSYMIQISSTPKPFDNVKLTATVSGNDLSFSRECYQNTYTSELGDISVGKTISELLTLYPVDPENYYIHYGGNPYVVTVTLESECFKQPIVEIYEFVIMDAEEQKVKEHTDFALHDTYYNVFKNNTYGKNMLAVKDDPDYLWSKWSTFDFENYYEVVIADILIQMLDVPQADVSIVPKILKDWYKSYNSLLKDINKIVTEDYGDMFDVSETKIDKVLKASKYRSTKGDYVDDVFYLAVVDALSDEMNAGEIKESFAKIDETKKVFEMVNMVKEPLKEVVAWGNTICVMNAFDQVDQELKDVFRALANEIPDDEYLMREAVLDYVNYTTDFSGKVYEIFDAFCEAAGKVTVSSFESVVGKKLWDCLAIKAVEWIGTIPIKGGTTLASTSAYNTLTSASSKAVASGVLTGVSIGLTLSDLICSSSSKASEMGKLIAMCEYSPYIVNVLVKQEAGLIQNQNMESVRMFESAFKLHQAAQSYILDQTAKTLKVKAESILQKLLGNEEYYSVVSDTLAQKRTVNSMNCCGTLSGETVVHTTKVLSVRCPVDVNILGFDGKKYVTIAKIIGETVEYCSDNAVAYVRDGEKFIALPADEAYYVEVIPYESGTMDYVIAEYDQDINEIKTVGKQDVPITKGEMIRSNGTMLPVAEIGFSRMILGNELAMQFAFPQVNVMDGEEYVVTITKTYADGRDDKVIEVPRSQWKTTSVSGEPYYYVSFNGIAAKEMNDAIHVQIKTSDATPAGSVFTTSVSKYALDQLRKTTDAKTRTLYVDMLNYGAAAQTYFSYDAEDLVTKDLTETEKGYGTKEVKLENNLVKGPGYVASQLDLGSSILLRVKFNGINSSMHAVVSFTSHTGAQKNVTIPGDQFISGGTVVVINQVVAADYNQDVTITVYDADGNEVANAVESVASYIARMTGGAEIYSAVAKYCAAAYGYLHK